MFPRVGLERKDFYGFLGQAKIMADAKLAGLENYFVEQGDNFAVSPMKSIELSAQYVRQPLE